MEKQKILVVDDDKHIAELISLYMMKEGYETREIYDYHADGEGRNL